MRISNLVILSFLVFSNVACSDTANTNATENKQNSEITETPPQESQTATIKAVEAKQAKPSPVVAPIQSEEKPVNQKETPKTEKRTKATPVPKIKIGESNPIAKEPNTPKLKTEATDLVKISGPEPPQQEKVVIQAPSQDIFIQEKPSIEQVSIKEMSHELWDQLLNKYVSSTGKVNYKAIKSDPADFNAYLKMLADNPVQDTWSRNQKMAYWINAYNAFTVKLIVDNYPLSSITKLHGGKPWDLKWITLGNKSYSLNNIEHDILRPQFKDPRIHFAVNCAAKSCPPLLNKAWTESNLNSNLEKQANFFINNSSFNSISANSIQISKIFEWYAEDFGNIIPYLNKYATTKINKNAKLGYSEYNWALNE